jgi:hypothetical protein
MMDVFQAGAVTASPSCSLVIPIVNEEAVLPQLVRRIGWLLDTVFPSSGRTSKTDRAS